MHVLEAIHAQVVNLLTLQSESIARSARRLAPDQVELAVELLASCADKAVCIGIGKSGIVARKIAATMTSTGTVAVYLHPSDALHGDLGAVTSNDVALAFSNSGETEELLAILPYLVRRQVPIIAITGNLRSTLARKSRVVLDASVDREACPLNLAPTASTTVSQAIGDALAMAVMQTKGLTPQEFALNHPSGRLGKRLTLMVGDLMHGGAANPTTLPESSWLEVVAAITRGGLGAVSVVDPRGHLAGIITDGDIRRVMLNLDSTDLKSLTAHSMMTHNPIHVTPETLAYDALQRMENRDSQISVLPVIDHDRCSVGLIRLHDIVRSGL